MILFSLKWKLPFHCILLARTPPNVQEFNSKKLAYLYK